MTEDTEVEHITNSFTRLSTAPPKSAWTIADEVDEIMTACIARSDFDLLVLERVDPEFFKWVECHMVHLPYVSDFPDPTGDTTTLYSAHKGRYSFYVYKTPEVAYQPVVTKRFYRFNSSMISVHVDAYMMLMFTSDQDDIE